MSTPSTGGTGFSPGDASTTSTTSSVAADLLEGVYNAALQAVTDLEAGDGNIQNVDAPVDSSLEALVGYKAGQEKGKQNWRERVENYSPWNDVFSMTQQETELVVDVPFENRYLFLVYALGYQYVDGDTLKRINPIRHPYWTWMRCARVAHKGVRFAGGKVRVGQGGSGVARYKLCRFSLGFANYPWHFYEDADINPAQGQEIFRNAYLEVKPTTQFLAAEGGAAVLGFPYKFTDGTLATARADQRAYPAPLGTPVNQVLYRLHWKWVPFDYIFKGLVPTNIVAAMNTLNTNLFLGQPEMVQGTVRFDAPEITTYVSPIRTVDRPELLCDVTFNLAFFDPPRGLPATSPGYTIRGHNLMPNRIDNKWYPATRNPDPKSSTAAFPAPTTANQLFAYSDETLPFRKAQ